MRNPLPHLAAGLALALVLAGPARADDERLALARDIVTKTVARNLTQAFKQAEEKTLSGLSAEQAAKMRPELDKTFGEERDTLVDQLSKEYAQKFDAAELKRLAGSTTTRSTRSSRRSTPTRPRWSPRSPRTR